MNAEDKQLLNELEAGEAWLASVMRDFPPPQPRAAEHLKLSVRIAAAESAVRMKLVQPPSASTLQRIKHNVRAELLRSHAQHQPKASGRRMPVVLGGLAAAAALAFWIVPFALQPAPDARTNMVSSLEVFSEVLASSATSDFDEQVDSMDDTLNELSEWLALPDWLGVGDQIDDLENDIDSLIEENRTWLNV